MPKMGKVYFSNSGSEANEKSYKIIRQATTIDPARKGKYKILYRDRDYHGTTIAVLASSGQAERKKDFGPFRRGLCRFPTACATAVPFGKNLPGLRHPVCQSRRGDHPQGRARIAWAG
jgi:taurine-pyruvate aminotransferase